MPRRLYHRYLQITLHRPSLGRRRADGRRDIVCLNHDARCADATCELVPGAAQALVGLPFGGALHALCRVAHLHTLSAALYAAQVTATAAPGSQCLSYFRSQRNARVASLSRGTTIGGLSSTGCNGVTPSCSTAIAYITCPRCVWTQVRTGTKPTPNSHVAHPTSSTCCVHTYSKS